MLTCTACGKFSTQVDAMMVLHQAECEGLSEEKRAFRMTIARMQFGEHLDEALALTRQHAASNC